MKKRWFIIPIVAVIALGLWSISTPSNAIVEARVNLTAPYGNGFLAQVEATKAFSNPKGEGLFFEVWSKCSLSINQIIDIKVPVSGIIFGRQPTSFEGSLYASDGTVFVQWDGC